MTSHEDRRNWTRDEILLAFVLYCIIPSSQVTPHNPKIIELASLINRTPNSVKLKLQNFKSYDPSYIVDGRVGLSHGSKLDAEVVAEFLNNWDGLILETEKIKNGINLFFEKSDEIMQELDIPQGHIREQVTQIRIGQSFFRKTVLASYENKCCITGLSVPKLLRASHIKPWSKSDGNEKTNPQNGLSLNALFMGISS